VNFVGKLSDLVFIIEKFLVSILVSLMFISLTLSVIYRYFLNHPLNWTDEMAIFSLVWATFLGGSMGIKRQQAAAVTILMDKIGGRTHRILISIGFFIAFLFSILILIIAFQWVLSPNIAVQKSASMQLPMIYPYLSVPVGFGFMTIHGLDLLLKSFKSTEAEVK
jgi:TRAP-type C4-dicarboxylate transport system permease small subunit